MSARGVRAFKKRNKGNYAAYTYFLTADRAVIEIESPLPSGIFKEIAGAMFRASEFGQRVLGRVKSRMPPRYAALLADELSPQADLNDEGNQPDDQPEGDEHENGVTS